MKYDVRLLSLENSWRRPTSRPNPEKKCAVLQSDRSELPKAEPARTVSPSMEESVTMKPGPLGEGLHQLPCGPGEENKALPVDGGFWTVYLSLLPMPPQEEQRVALKEPADSETPSSLFWHDESLISR